MYYVLQGIIMSLGLDWSKGQRNISKFFSTMAKKIQIFEKLTLDQTVSS